MVLNRAMGKGENPTYKIYSSAQDKVMPATCAKERFKALHDLKNMKIAVVNMKTAVHFFFIGVLWPVKIISHFEPSQSVSGAKMGDPQEKTPDHPQAVLGLSHM